MYTNTSCTLFLRSRDYMPLLIEKCYMTHRKTASTDKGGLKYNESAFIMFPLIDLEFTEGEDFVIEGQRDIAVSVKTEKDVALTKAKFHKAKAFTVMAADAKKYGSLNMRHWELSCK